MRTYPYCIPPSISHTNQQTNKHPITGALPSFLVGPEGGFSPAELQAFDDAQNKQTNDPNNPAVSSSAPPVRCVSLGPSVLRAETAAAVALGCFGMWRDGRVSNGVGEGVEGA